MGYPSLRQKAWGRRLEVSLDNKYIMTRLGTVQRALYLFSTLLFFSFLFFVWFFGCPIPFKLRCASNNEGKHVNYSRRYNLVPPFLTHYCSFCCCYSVSSRELLISLRIKPVWHATPFLYEFCFSLNVLCVLRREWVVVRGLRPSIHYTYRAVTDRLIDRHEGTVKVRGGNENNSIEE